LIIWATILGASGAFLAIPLSLFVKSLFVDVDPEHDWLVPLLSSGNGKNGNGKKVAEVARTQGATAAELDKASEAEGSEP
jgi:hypothetical protein